MDRFEGEKDRGIGSAEAPVDRVAVSSASRTPRSFARVLAVVGAVIGGGSVGATIGGLIDALRFEAAFRADAERRVADAASRLAAKLWVGYAFRGFFLGSEEVTEAEFGEFAQWVRVADPDIRSCAFVREVSLPDSSASRRFEIALRSPADADFGGAFAEAMASSPDWVSALETSRRNDRVCILTLASARAVQAARTDDELVLLLPLRRTSAAAASEAVSGFLASTFRAHSLVQVHDERGLGAAETAQLFVLNPDRAPGDRVVVDLGATGPDPAHRLSRIELEELASATVALGVSRDLAPEISRLRLVCLDPEARAVVRFDEYAAIGALLGATFIGCIALMIRRRARVAEQLRQRLEEIVERRTADLEAANADLEAFAHTVSHDLGAPLRAIEGFASELKDSLGSEVDATQHRYLETLMRNSARASEIVAGLLALSKWTRIPIEFRELDTPALVKDATDEVLAVDPDRKVELVVGELPRVRGDSRLVRQVFANLISNAVKYTRDRDRSRIEIRGSTRGDRVEFEVIDNGIGFDSKRGTRLFRPFQRLPNAREFEGSGIGLALAARIVARHGGTISAEGKIGSGATFRFTLPSAANDQPTR